MLLDLFHYAQIDTAHLSAIAIASVVPALDAVLDEVARVWFSKKAFFVRSGPHCPVPIHYGNPQEAGADRIANVAAAYALYGGPAIVIDFGTATNFDCVDETGAYMGGVIAPGPHISAESLVRRTAKLPRVEIAVPERAIGRSTAGCIQSGLYYGYIGLIKEVLSRIKKEMPSSPHIIATGGLAPLIVPEISDVEAIVPELTMEGIWIIWQKETTV
jgi:type III pantothenate kinase